MESLAGGRKREYDYYFLDDVSVEGKLLAAGT